MLKENTRLTVASIHRCCHEMQRAASDIQQMVVMTRELIEESRERIREANLLLTQW